MIVCTWKLTPSRTYQASQRARRSKVLWWAKAASHQGLTRPRARRWPAVTSTARRPAAATEWMGWKLRTASGRRRSVSVIRPTVEGLASWSYQEPNRPRRPRRVKVGTTTVPAGPTASRNPSITASAPPATVPRLRSELWKKTVSPLPTPSRRSPAATPSRVTRGASPSLATGPAPAPPGRRSPAGRIPRSDRPTIPSPAWALRDRLQVFVQRGLGALLDAVQAVPHADLLGVDVRQPGGD